MSEFSPGVQAVIDQATAAAQIVRQHRARVRQRRFDTIAVHGIYNMQEALANQGSIIEPAFFAPAQHFANSDTMEAALAYQIPAWTYSRVANPTLHYLEETLALLEGYGLEAETHATLTSSGMAAVFLATVPFLSIEDGRQMNIVASARCYGGTFQLFSQRYAVERGVEVRWVQDPLNLDDWASKIDDQTRFVFGETPSNPGLSMFDMAGVAELAHAAGIPLIVDPTVATPALMRPLLDGADIIVHSVSKSLSFSGFVIAGAVIAPVNIPSRVGPDELRANFALYCKGFPLRDHGPALSPFNALMALNDLRTLRHRMDFLSVNTLRIAHWLEAHPKVEHVYYPGLSSNAEHEIAQQTMWLVDGDASGQPANRYGHLLSFTLKDGLQAARATFDSFEMIWRGTDLGKVKSVATIPAISTHQQQGESGRSLAAVQPGQIRLSVGAEHPDDILADLEQALSQA